MISKIFNVLKQPYPSFLEFSKSFPAILIASIFIPLFLLVFQPFGLGNYHSPGRTWYVLSYGPFTFTFLCFNFYGFTKLFPGFFEEENWLVWKESAWILWNVFAGGLAAISYHYATPFCTSSYPELFQNLLQAFIIATIPETFYVLATYNAFLRNRLRNAERINQALRNAARPAEDMKLELASETGKETVIISLQDLLFIQSTDNYSNIVKKGKNGLKKTLLRSSLRKLEEQIRTPLVIRCHRSYIVNLAKVNEVNGNARGYKLFLQDYAAPIPVARDSARQVLDALTEFAGEKTACAKRSA
jgi:hypothetical protein